MQVVNGFPCLVDDVSLVLVSQHVLPDESVEVDIHELEQQIDVSLVLRPDHFFQLDYVRVFELSQKHYLSVGPLRISRVLEGIKILF